MDIKNYIKNHAEVIWQAICLTGALIIVASLIYYSQTDEEPEEEVLENNRVVEEVINNFYYDFNADAKGEHLVIMKAQAHNRGDEFNTKFRLIDLDGEASKYRTFHSMESIPLAGMSDNFENNDTLTQNERLKLEYERKCLVFIEDIEALGSGDTDTVIRYFGESFEELTADVADKVSATFVNFITEEYNPEGPKDTIYAHICTIDYPLMQEEYLQLLESARGSDLISTDEEYIELAKSGVVKRLIDGAYNTCYNMPIRIEDNKVVVTEELKRVITGNWYQSPIDVRSDLASVDCILE